MQKYSAWHMLPISLPGKLREIRKFKGISAPKLSNMIGIHKRTLNYWESRTKSANIYNAEAWANALGYDFYIVLVPRYPPDE